MTSTEIKKDIYWVGAIDWHLRDFHGYTTEKGSTYNAFLVIDEKTTLIDTVKPGFWFDLIHNIRRIHDPEKIDYLVINHVEMDHSGCMKEVIQQIKPKKIICSPMGKSAIDEHFGNPDWPFEVVKTGDEISIGKRTLKFYESRMLHWPDSMCTLLKEDKIFFTNDIFGQHYATSEVFDDQVPYDELMYQAKKYYANIILPYGKLVGRFLQMLEDEKVDFDTLATDHGVVWRKHVGDIVAKYKEWMVQTPKRKVVIVYDTMWGSTDLMAKAIERGIREEGVSVKVINMHHAYRSDVITDLMDAQAVLFGSSTLNGQILPTMADVLTYVKGLRPEGKIGAAFGSYGWGGEAVKQLTQIMHDMKIEIVDPGVRVKYVPTHEDLFSCAEMGMKIAKKVKEMVPE